LAVQAITGGVVRAGRRPGVTEVEQALHRYRERQAEAALVSESTRSALLEIGDRMHGLHLAISNLSSEVHADPLEGEDPESLVAAAIHDAIDPYLRKLGSGIGFPSWGTWRAASHYFHQRFGPLVDLSPLTSRCFHKPLGYAGDFEMMNMCYRNESLGDALFGRSLTRVALDSDAGRAVRHRMRYLAAKLEAALTPDRPRPIRILSVAAGPAMELQLLMEEQAWLLEAGRVDLALLDQDPAALEHASQCLHALAGRAGIEINLRCVNTSIRTVMEVGLDDSYDLIYSAGLFDYLNDRTVRRAAARLVERLTEGGTAIIGNFNTINPTRPFMELILDWPLFHRSADDLSWLFAGLGQGMTVEQESTGVNLFAVIEA
jgi:hypothetical protein